MNILRYIKGLRRGKEAHYIELEALRDVFLSEALEGYDAIEDNHLKRITYLQKQVENYCHKKNKNIASVAIKPAPKQTPPKSENNISWKKWSVAAIFLLCLVVLGCYYIIENHESLFKFRSAVLSGYQKKTENVEIEIADTLKVQQDAPQDTLLIYMPEPPAPKKNPIAYWRTSQDSLTEDRSEIEISKLDAPQTQLQVPVAPESESGTENTENVN